MEDNSKARQRIRFYLYCVIGGAMVASAFTMMAVT
jgi:hypothetical protein